MMGVHLFTKMTMAAVLKCGQLLFISCCLLNSDPAVNCRDKVECDNCSSEDESDVPALIQRYLSDSDSSKDYQCLASRRGWYDEVSDDTSTLCHSRRSEDTENPH
jgi:hypothetical protein